MRFFGGVFNDRRTLGPYGRQHNIDRRTDRNYVHVNIVADQLFCGNVYHSAFQRIGCTERRKAFQVLIDRAHAEIAAAGHADHRVAKPAEQSAQQVIRAADMPGQLIRSHTAVNRPRVDLNGRRVDLADFSPHIIQNPGNCCNIGYIGNVFDSANIIRHNSCRNNGNSSIFSATHDYFTGQPFATGNHKFIQRGTLQSLY